MCGGGSKSPPPAPTPAAAPAPPAAPPAAPVLDAEGIEKSNDSAAVESKRKGTRAFRIDLAGTSGAPITGGSGLNIPT